MIKGRKLWLYMALGALISLCGCSKEESAAQNDASKEKMTDAQIAAEVNEKLAKGELKLDVNITQAREKDSVDEAYKADLEAKRKEAIKKVNIAIGEYEIKKAELQRAKDTKASDDAILKLEKECEELKANYEKLEAKRQAEMRRIIRERKLRAAARANAEAYKKLFEEEKAKKNR